MGLPIVLVVSFAILMLRLALGRSVRVAFFLGEYVFVTLMRHFASLVAPSREACLCFG